MSINKIAIVVVLYNTSVADHLHRLEIEAKNKYLIIYVDNTPHAIKKDSSDGNIIEISLGVNNGIAWALNTGLNRAIQLGCEFIFTFDQDSSIYINDLDGLYEDYIKLQSLGCKLLAIGPHPINRDTGVSYLRRKDRIRKFLFDSGKHNNNFLLVNELITSGLLVSASTFNIVGNYREDLFIDYVDYEWCWRLNKYGGCCYVSLGTNLQHMVGQGDIPYTWGMKLGAPVRNYYLFRNGINLILNNKMPLFDSFKFLILIPIKLIFYITMNDGLVRVKNAIRGIVDGLKNRMNVF